MASTRRRWRSGGSAVQRQIIELAQQFPSPPSCPSSRRPSSLRFASTLCCRSMTVCLASHDFTVDSLLAAPLPGTAWHQPAAGGRGRQAQEEDVRHLSDRLLEGQGMVGPVIAILMMGSTRQASSLMRRISSVALCSARVARFPTLQTRARAALTSFSTRDGVLTTSGVKSTVSIGLASEASAFQRSKGTIFWMRL
jgi:hypothetical protein